MKKIIVVTFAALFLVCFNSFAQIKNDPKNVVLKPTFIVGDVIFAYNILNTIEITGAEVEPFLECKNALKGIIDSATKENMKPTDNITADIPLVTAQNLSSFLSRGKFKGENAVNFKRFMDSMVKSAEAMKK